MQARSTSTGCIFRESSGSSCRSISVSTDPNTPYLITHQIALADGHGGHESAALNQLLLTAEHWNLLTA